MEDAKTRYIKMWKNADRNSPKITFNQEEFKGLANIMGKHSIEKIIEESLRDTQIYLSNYNNCELLLRSEYVPVQTIVIVRIGVYPTQQGIGTAILIWLKAYAKEKGFGRIVIENANTEDSVHFAVKRGFSKCYQPINEFLDTGKFENDVTGDYELFL